MTAPTVWSRRSKCTYPSLFCCGFKRQASDERSRAAPTNALLRRARRGPALPLIETFDLLALINQTEQTATEEQDAPCLFALSGHGASFCGGSLQHASPYLHRLWLHASISAFAMSILRRAACLT